MTLPWDPNSEGSIWPREASARPLFSAEGYWTSLDTCAEALALSIPKHQWPEDCQRLWRMCMGQVPNFPPPGNSHIPILPGVFCKALLHYSEVAALGPPQAGSAVIHAFLKALLLLFSW